MGYRNNPLMEPEFFTPPGSKRLYKGGGSGQVYYANQDKLAGVQADIATNLYNQYAAYAPQALGNLSDMAADAKSGQYTRDLRNRAGTDAAAAAGMERAAVERQMASMGVNPNDPRFSGALRATALGNAANIAAAKNKAGQYGDDMAWARSQDFYNSLAGMPSQSASMLASSGAQYGQLGGAMQQQSNANARGYGQFGAQIAGGVFKADGGYIDEPRFALGGSVAGQAGGMPQLGNWRDRPSGFKMDDMSAGDKVMAVAAPIAMHAGANALGKHVINPLMDKAGAAIGDAVGGLFGGSAAASGANALWGAETAALGSGLAATPTTALATQAIGDTALTSTLAAEAAGAGGTSLAAGSAAGAAGAGLASTAAAALPWVGGAYLLGSALDLWADGGPVPHEQPRGLRLDMRAGGATPDVGTETSDSIPAWLSKGEYVVNADAVKDVGKDKLEKINEKGLKKRYGKRKGGKGGRA